MPTLQLMVFGIFFGKYANKINFMPTPLWIEKLKHRWNVNSPWQVAIILIVFACTGFSVYFLKRPLVNFLTGEQQGNTVVTSILYYIFILPIYNILLLGYGFVFGQFRFFWVFEKRLFNRLFRRSNNKFFTNTTKKSQP